MAVLLDNFITASTLMDNEARDKLLRERKSLSQFKNPLEPLILRLASRSSIPYLLRLASRSSIPYLLP